MKKITLSKRGKGFLGEFKEFALKGNMIDLAVGVIVGGAFQGIVNSVVKDLIMPLIGVITGGVDFSNKFIVLGKIPMNADGTMPDVSTLEAARKVVSVFAYGSFITAVINFMIMAFVIFLLVKGINSLRKLRQADQKEEEPTEKVCVYCKRLVPFLAMRCPFCTSELDEE